MRQVLWFEIHVQMCRSWNAGRIVLTWSSAAIFLLKKKLLEADSNLMIRRGVRLPGVSNSTFFTSICCSSLYQDWLKDIGMAGESEDEDDEDNDEDNDMGEGGREGSKGDETHEGVCMCVEIISGDDGQG